MKKFIYIISAALLLAGCNFLDFDETSALYDRDDMYTTYSNVQKMLTNLYGYMPNKEIVDVSDAMRDCGSDDAEFGDPSASVQRFNNGNWSALSTVDTKSTTRSAPRTTSSRKSKRSTSPVTSMTASMPAGRSTWPSTPMRPVPFAPTTSSNWPAATATSRCR